MKFSKDQQDLKGIIVRHKLHEPREKLDHGDYLYIASIDPAVKNYCVRIEKRPKVVNGKGIETIKFFRLSLEKIPGYEHEGENSSLYYILDKLLDELYPQLYICDIIIIEKQLPFKPVNIKVEQHTISYVLHYLKNSPYNPEMIEMDAKTKAKIIGYKGGLNDKAFKKWCSAKAIEILENRNDQLCLSIINKEKPKIDDLCDTICQIESLMRMRKFPTSEEIYSGIE
jgi:hypothetical protein